MHNHLIHKGIRLSTCLPIGENVYLQSVAALSEAISWQTLKFPLLAEAKELGDFHGRWHADCCAKIA